MRFKMMKYYETVDVVSKKIAALDTNDQDNPPRPSALRLQLSIRQTAHAYLQVGCKFRTVVFDFKLRGSLHIFRLLILDHTEPATCSCIIIDAARHVLENVFLGHLLVLRKRCGLTAPHASYKSLVTGLIYGCSRSRFIYRVVLESNRASFVISVNLLIFIFNVI